MFDNWVAACPLHYTSPNASKKRDVLGTMVLSILAGHRSHHGGARGWRQPGPAGDGASEDAVRPLKKMPERRSGCAAISTRRRCWEFLGFWTWIPWSSRCSAIRKERAIIRTSRAGPLHTYWVAGLRLVLDVEVKAGNEQAHSAPALWGLLDRLGRDRWPWLLRRAPETVGQLRLLQPRTRTLDSTLHELFTLLYPAKPANNVQPVPLAAAARAAPRFLVLSRTARLPTAGFAAVVFSPPKGALVIAPSADTHSQSIPTSPS
jgi:hypothetical protein